MAIRSTWSRRGASRSSLNASVSADASGFDPRIHRRNRGANANGVKMPILKTGVVVIAALLPQMAVADGLPRQFQGHWCGRADSDEGMRRVPRPCKADEDTDSITISGSRVFYYADSGSAFLRCNVGAAANYKPRNPDYRNTYLARLSCNDPQVNGTYWFEIMDGRLQHRLSSRSLLGSAGSRCAPQLSASQHAVNLPRVGDIVHSYFCLTLRGRGLNS
jgi:hypothetical protein